MKNILLLFFLLCSVSLFAQFPNNPVKVRLGYQTTSKGLIYYGTGAPSSSPTGFRNDAFAYVDTTANTMYLYDESNDLWEFVTDSIYVSAVIADTATVLRAYADQAEQDAKDYADANDDAGLSESAISSIVSDSLADNRAVVFSSTAPDSTSVWVDDTDNTVKIRNGNEWMQLSPDRQFMTITDLLNNSNKIPFRLGETVEVMITGATYEVVDINIYNERLGSLTEWPVDSLTSIQKGSKYLLMIPDKSGSFSFSNFIIDNSFDQTNKLQKAIDYVNRYQIGDRDLFASGASYTGLRDSSALVKRIPKTIYIDRQFEITNTIYLYDNVHLKGVNNSYTNKSRKSTNIYANLNDSTKTAIEFRGTDAALNGDLSSHGTGIIEDVSLWATSSCYAIVNTRNASGAALKNISINGRDAMNTGDIVAKYGIITSGNIYFDIDNVQILNVDTAFYADVNEYVSTSTTSFIRNLNILTCNYGIVLTNFAFNQIEFENLTFDVINNVPFTMESGTFCVIDGMYLENSPDRFGTCPECPIFRVGTKRFASTPSLDATLVIENAYIQGGFDSPDFSGRTFIEADTVSNISVSSSWIRNVANALSTTSATRSVVFSNVRDDSKNNLKEQLTGTADTDLIFDSTRVRVYALTGEISTDPFDWIYIEGDKLTGDIIAQDEVILENDKYLKGKQTGGTLSNLIGLQTDNSIVVGKGVSDVIRLAGTENDFDVYPDDDRIFSRVGDVDFSSNTAGNATFDFTNSNVASNSRSQISVTNGNATINMLAANQIYSILPWSNSGVISTNSSTSNGLKIRTSNGPISLTSGNLFESDITLDEGTVKFDKYADGNKVAGSLSKTQSQYYPVFATDGTILEEQITNPTGGTNTVQASLDSLDQNSTWTKEEIEAGNNVDINGDSTATYSIDNLGSYTARVFDGVTASRLLMTPSLASLLNGTSANLRLESSGAKLAYGANEVLVNGTTTTVTGGLTVDNYTFNSDQDTTGRDGQVMAFNSTTEELELKKVFECERNASATTSGTGSVTVSHSLGVAPSVTITNSSATPYLISISSVTTTNFTFFVYDTIGSSVNSTAINFDYQLIVPE